MQKLSDQKKTGKGNFVHVAIGCILMLGIGFLPPAAPITEYGMKVLGIFVGMIYLWITCSVLWPSILGIIGMLLVGQSSASDIIASALGNDQVWFIIFIGILLVPMTQEHVTDYIAKFFLTRKISRNRPWAFSFLFFYATFVVAMIANAVPAIMLMWAILYSILNVGNIKSGEKFATHMIFGVVYASALGTSAFPFKGAAMIILNAYRTVSGAEINPVGYWIVALVVCTILLISYTLFGKYVLHIDVSKITSVDAKQYFESKGLITMSARQKTLLGMLGVNTVLLLWPSIMPSGWLISTYISRLSSWGSVALVMVIMMIIPVEGKPLLNFNQAAAKVEWGTVFLVASALYVAGELSTEATGIVAYIEQLFTASSLFGSEIAILFFFLLVGFIVTNFANNAAMGVMLMPILYAVTRSGNYHSIAIAACLAMVLFQAFLTPSASPHASLLHGNKDWITLKEIYFYGFSVSIYSILVIAAVGMPLGILILN